MSQRAKSATKNNESEPRDFELARDIQDKLLHTTGHIAEGSHIALKTEERQQLLRDESHIMSEEHLHLNHMKASLGNSKKHP